MAENVLRCSKTSGHSKPTDPTSKQRHGLLAQRVCPSAFWAYAFSKELSINQFWATFTAKSKASRFPFLFKHDFYDWYQNILDNTGFRKLSLSQGQLRSALLRRILWEIWYHVSGTALPCAQKLESLETEFQAILQRYVNTFRRGQLCRWDLFIDTQTRIDHRKYAMY